MLNLCGFVNSSLGQGSIAREIENALQFYKVPHNLNEIISPCHKYDRIYQTTKDSNFPINIICCNPDNISLLPNRYLKPPISMNYTEYYKKYNIGIWFWELENIPINWIKRADLFDEIWASSSFIFNTLKRQLPNKKISRVNIPISVPEKLNTIECKSKIGIDSDSFTCLFAFDYRSDHHRKNPYAVIESFKMAFMNGEKCNLIIKSQNGNKEEIDLLNKSINGDNRIISIQDTYNRIQMNELMNSCDIYVSLHRSEGLGLTMMESILLEKPTICTNYSGNTDFCKPEWCELVEYEMVNIPMDGLYRKLIGNINAKWANPSVVDASNKIKKVYSDINQYVEKSKIGKEWIINNYNKKSIVDKIYTL